MRETNVSKPLMKHRNQLGDIQTRVSQMSWDKGVEGYLLTVRVAERVNDFETPGGLI